jgi:hypothetical protein
VKFIGSPDPPNADASTLSPGAEERAEDSRGGGGDDYKAEVEGSECSRH